MLDSCKMAEKQSEPFHTFLQHFSKYKTECYCISFFKLSSCPDSIFEIRQPWQSGFSRVYSNCCCSCSFKREILKIAQSSHKIYSNNNLNFEESTIILNAYIKKGWKLIEYTTYFVLLAAIRALLFFQRSQTIVFLVCCLFYDCFL